MEEEPSAAAPGPEEPTQPNADANAVAELRNTETPGISQAEDMDGSQYGMMMNLEDGKCMNPPTHGRTAT